jgi:hypothetical protein
MEELFSTDLPDGQHPDIQLCIFPHLKEFLAIDQREGPPRILLLNAEEVFTEDFFKAVEAEFSEAVRAETEFPFAHLINLPLRQEEAIKETAMTFILERLGVGPDVESVPTAVVFIVSGGALAAQSELVLDGLRQLLRANCGQPAVAEWEEVLSRLIIEENAVLQKLNRLELTEALQGDSPDYFTLWEHRN